MKIRLVCVNNGFVLESDTDYELKRKLKNGSVYEATIKLARNVKFHRMYFALINCAWENIGEKWQTFFGNNKDGFRKTIEVASGHYDTIYSPARNEWVQIPKSIAFDKMTEEEFGTLYERVKDVLYSFFLNNVSKADFEEQLKYF